MRPRDHIRVMVLPASPKLRVIDVYARTAYEYCMKSVSNSVGSTLHAQM